LKRPGYFVDLDALEQQIPGVKRAVVFVNAPELNVSASDIRSRAARGESIREFVPAAVAEYIETHHLYRNVNV
jgi:nicotinate-nucleotide adenylyltransferase